jgi:hypothetical protein
VSDADTPRLLPQYAHARDAQTRESGAVQRGVDLEPRTTDDLGDRQQLRNPRRNLTGIGHAGLHVAVEVEVGDLADQLYLWVVHGHARRQPSAQNAHRRIAGNVAIIFTATHVRPRRACAKC